MRWWSSASLRSQAALAILILGLLSFPAVAQFQPLDLFSDAPELGQDFVRIACWNLRHINLEGDAEDLLPGVTEEEDFAVLVATFANAIQEPEQRRSSCGVCRLRTAGKGGMRHGSKGHECARSNQDR